MLSLSAYLLDAPFFDVVFERHRGRSYENALSISGFVRLPKHALLEHLGSARNALVLRHDLKVRDAQ